MQFPRPYSLKEISDIIQCTFIGNSNFQILGMNEIHRVKIGEIVFVDHPKYYTKALQSEATTILINEEVECPKGKTLLISDDPFRDFVKLGQYFTQENKQKELQNKSAIIGKDTYLAPNVYIGKDVKIGNNCTIYANVSIGDRTIIGDNVIIHPGTVIGGDAFYYKKREFGYDKLKSIGNVIINNNVEIGANCTIDRGVTASTVIGEGSKLDNLIQIGHDTTIGKRCLIASQVGIAGCCSIGNEVTLWGQSAVTSGISIGDKAVIGGKSGVTKSISGGKLYMGMPAEEGKKAYKKYAFINSLQKEYEKR